MAPDNDEIVKRAEAVIAHANAQGGTPVLMGLPLNVDTSKDPSMSEATYNLCSTCSTPVKSTVVKDTILKLTENEPKEKRAVLLCVKCMKAAIEMQVKQDNKPAEITVTKL